MSEKGILYIWKCLIVASSPLRPEVGNLIRIHLLKILHKFLINNLFGVQTSRLLHGSDLLCRLPLLKMIKHRAQPSGSVTAPCFRPVRAQWKIPLALSGILCINVGNPKPHVKTWGYYNVALSGLKYLFEYPLIRGYLKRVLNIKA